MADRSPLAGALLFLLAGCSARTLDGVDCAPAPDDAGTSSDGTHCCTGTPESAVECLPCPDDDFELRLGTREVLADGATPVPLLVIGTDPEGEPSTATIVLRLSRSDAGALVDGALTLTPLGATTEFVPCDALEPGCLGSFSIDLTYPGEPTEVVASVAGVLVSD